MRKLYCDHDCNNCLLLLDPNYKQIYAVFYELLRKLELKVLKKLVLDITEEFCPNMNCCPECSMEMFEHTKDCSFVMELDGHPKKEKKNPKEDLIDEVEYF